MHAHEIVRVTIDNDQDAENPLDHGGWKVHTFDRGKLSTCCDPTDYIKSYDGGTVTPANIGLRRKLEVGTAFWISIYEHGGRVYSLMDEGPQCRWDTARLAGILIWEDGVSELGPRTLAGREEDARAILDIYTDWSNGACYSYTIEKATHLSEVGEEFDPEIDVDDLDDLDWQDVDSSSGCIGEDHVVSSIRDALRDARLPRVDIIDGQCAWVTHADELTPVALEASHRRD